jgi:hypothetical protein
VTPTIKTASPILLTKDGNRAADSVIASNLAWNWGTVSVDAYEFCNAFLDDYLDDYLSLDQISLDVYANGAGGFFTATSPANNTGTAGTTIDITTIPAAWIDGYRVVDNNFRGIILGGKAAVSKDKAKQLDDTVKDSIRTVNDPVANNNSASITINGKTYRTLSWLYDQSSAWFSNLGVNGWGTATATTPGWKDTFSAAEVIAVPYGNYGLYRYLYQPYDISNATITYNTDGSVWTESYTIEFAGYDSNSVNAFAPTNGYTGYGFAGYASLNVFFDYNTPANSTATWVQNW